ncbi:stalk domain-containing protein [Flavonifractor sp. AGMB03687]|uniref:stalk domain-containing protein n=1 Tax=Flavonifractor sp. AGMB03687 TaxID=2785133 RepID=UPI001ADF9B85|nr:stalk domain-containing protein [Flavonifractor sp. AGMB03687]
MKKLAPALLSLALAGTLCLPAMAAPLAIDSANDADAASGYTLQVNGTSTDIDVCVMVPLRALAEELGFTVTWNGSSVRVDTGDVHTDVTIGVDRYVITTSHEDMVGMSAPFSLGCAPYATNGVTYVPLSLFDALLGNQEDAITGDTGVISIQTDTSAQIPNPFVDCDTLAQAEDLAGFSLTLPADVKTDGISVLSGNMIQVLCEDGLSIRKALGDEDISGDYNSYPQVETVTVEGHAVTLKGTGDQVTVAVWTADGYTYAVHSETGLSRDAALSLASQVA